LKLEKFTILNAVTIAQWLQCAPPMMGALSDRIGRKRLFLIGSLLMAPSHFPTFYLLDQKTTICGRDSYGSGRGLIWAPLSLRSHPDVGIFRHA